MVNLSRQSVEWSAGGTSKTGSVSCSRHWQGVCAEDAAGKHPAVAADKRKPQNQSFTPCHQESTIRNGVHQETLITRASFVHSSHNNPVFPDLADKDEKGMKVQASKALQGEHLKQIAQKKKAICFVGANYKFRDKISNNSGLD